MLLNNMENVEIGLLASHICAMQDSLPVLRTAQFDHNFKKASKVQAPSLCSKQARISNVQNKPACQCLNSH